MRVSSRYIHNVLVSSPKCGVLKEARDEKNNSIINDYVILNFLPPQLKKVLEYHRVVCGCYFCISSKSVHSSLLKFSGCFMNRIKDQIHNNHNRRSGSMKITFLKPIIIMWCHMVVMYKKQNNTCLWQYCVPFHQINMFCLTVNMCCVFVPNAQVLS